MRQLLALIITSYVVINGYANDVYIKTALNGNILPNDSIPTISYSDECTFELIGKSSTEELEWWVRFELNDKSGLAGTIYYKYNPQHTDDYSFSFKQLATTIGLPIKNDPSLTWNTVDGLLCATIIASNQYGKTDMRPIYVDFTPDAPIVEEITIEPTHVTSTVTAVDVYLRWNMPESDIMPVQVVVEFCLEDGDRMISIFDEHGIQSTTADYLCDTDWIKIYSRNQYTSSDVQTFYIKDYLSGIENVITDNDNRTVMAINYYNLNGVLVYSTDYDDVNEPLPQGIYIKETTFDCGNRKCTKILIR